MGAMTATEELRRMLDERGVEWSATVGAIGTIWTHWDAFNGQRIHAMDNEDGTVEIFDQWNLTPAQAIAATLGVGTCKPREVRSWFSKTQEYVTYHCECGHELGGYMTAELPFPHTYNEDKLPNFCPNCGRKVVDDG